jgi:hypothetical protein
MKMKKTWTGKKSPTNPIQKEKHQTRKYRVVYLYEIETKEKQQEIEEYNGTRFNDRLE